MSKIPAGQLCEDCGVRKATGYDRDPTTGEVRDYLCRECNNRRAARS